jgi:hypothetical protein
MCFVEAFGGNQALATHDGEIRSTQAFKYLGIWFDADLSFSTHCSKLIAKVKSKLYMMLRYPKYRNWRERRMLFFAFVYPAFNYGIECYMHCSNTQRQKLEYLFRRCGRIVLNSSVPRYDTSIYAQLDVLPLRYLFQQRCATFLYTVLREDSVATFSSYFRFNHTSRHQSDMVIPLVANECSRRSIRYWGAKLWNSIPVDIRAASTIQLFKVSYEAYLRTKINEFADSYDLYDFR